MSATDSGTSATGAPHDDASHGRGSSLGSSLRRYAAGRSLLARYGVFLFLVVMTVGFSIALPDTFATAGNFRSMVNAQAIVLMLAGAATIALRVGEFDLSISATMALSAAIVAVLSVGGAPTIAAVGLGLAAGLLVGVANGFLVVRVGVSSFIVTLGMLTALGGIAFGVTDSRVISGVPDGVRALARTSIAGLPISTWWGWAVVALLWYLYERTPLGRYMVFIGGNPNAARLAGLPVNRIRFLAFVASGALSGFVGVLLVGRLGAMDPSVGPQYLLQPFAAAFLGAAAVHVGRFNALGTLIALYLIAVGIVGLQLLGAEPWVASVFNGAALIAAVTVARLVASED